jgi:hypothetical protein
MKPNTVALVAHSEKSRTQIAKYLRDGGYDVFECDDVATAKPFLGVVIVDEADSTEQTRACVQSWLELASSPRVVVISSKPTGWKALALAYSDDLYVLAAPAFGWEIVEALRPSPTLPAA